MRYLKIASANNPDTDFIELNDFNGFLCTSFQGLGISRKNEWVQIKNTNIAVDNTTEFNTYSLIIQILTKYSEYEARYRRLITFLDRNKKSGFRLYFKPYDNVDMRYCLCDITKTAKVEKLQPVTLTLKQKSMWFGEVQSVSTAQTETSGNFFEFKNDGNGYYSTGFYYDGDITNIYSISFSVGTETKAIITNNSYNEIPLNIKIYGKCVNPVISLYKKDESEPIRQLQIIASISDGYYVDIKSSILDNGVYYVNANTGEIIQDYSSLVNNELGSPFFYIDNGEYYVRVVDSGNNDTLCVITYQEEYSE